MRSDCKALEWLKTAPLNDIVTKWHTRLQHYDFDVVHRPGAKSQNVDGLTRQPIVDASCYGIEPLPVLDNIKPRNITIRAVQTRRATVFFFFFFKDLKCLIKRSTGTDTCKGKLKGNAWKPLEYMYDKQCGTPVT